MQNCSGLQPESYLYRAGRLSCVLPERIANSHALGANCLSAGLQPLSALSQLAIETCGFGDFKFWKQMQRRKEGQ